MNFAETEDEIKACFPVMKELRPHLNEEQFFSAVSRMCKNGYFLVYRKAQNEIVSVAGVRVSEWLHTGMYLEIEDFITKETFRSQGIGGALFEEIKNYAKENGCNQVRLVSGVQRDKAHKFYLDKGMNYEAKYFSINL